MQGLTVLGADPYNAQQPVLRAQPTSSDGAQVRRPEIVDPAEDGPEPTPLKLAPPPPLIPRRSRMASASIRWRRRPSRCSA